MRRSMLIWAVLLSGCHGEKQAAAGGECMSPAAVADYVHTVIEADRATYAEQVVHRLQDVEKVIKASESFSEDKALPLPSQMMRMGAKAAAARNGGAMHYALISPWAINKANLPKTDFEKQGFAQLGANPDAPYRAFQQVGEGRYFTALYADKAVSEACVGCHNTHPRSPRTDFKLGDVMGGVVVSMKVN
jgi:uncharacterized protein DUF3365